jgi:hypothetical protein
MNPSESSLWDGNSLLFFSFLIFLLLLLASPFLPFFVTQGRFTSQSFKIRSLRLDFAGPSAEMTPHCGPRGSVGRGLSGPQYGLDRSNDDNENRAGMSLIN